MIGDMGVRVREAEIVDVVRMRKKDKGGSIRPIIVEFKTASGQCYEINKICGR